MSDLLQYFPIENPTMVFFTVLIIILFAPIVMSKLRIPHIVGMVLAGVVIGKYGFNIIERDSSFELFGRVGLLYIMFLAGLEMDFAGLKRNLRSVGLFGVLTFALPFVMMYFAAIYLLHYSHIASILLCCIMSSNTLIAYPIVARYGLQKHDISVLSVGASMLSLLMALVVVAAVVGSYDGGGSLGYWVLFVLKFFGYCVFIFFAIRSLTRWFLRRYSDAVMQFIFVLSMLFMSASLCEIIGLEGILGAFFSGLILNRFIPSISPLMNRIEFIGNAIFIPYFLIGVGMLINVGLLFEGGGIIFTVLCIVIVGTLGKAMAAYLSCFMLRMPWLNGHFMFGLTSAHAAGGIAIVMIGMNLTTVSGVSLIGHDMLNGVVIMILVTCIISTIITDASAKRIILTDPNYARRMEEGDDEKILIPVKYPETCNTLVNLAIMMSNHHLNRGLIALNVVYDDDDAEVNQRKGQQLLDSVVSRASAMDVRVQTQVRLATNIGNGIKHAFKEYDCSEIILGLHVHDNSSRLFWGDFAQSVFNGLSRQIIIARCTQPFSTLRALRVAVPSRAEFEPGFYRWVERLCRFAASIGCRTEFNGRSETLRLIRQYVTNRHPHVRAEYTEMPKWSGVINLAQNTSSEEMLIVVTARQGTVSYKVALDRLPDELTNYYMGHNIMIIFPDQYGPPLDSMTFAAAQHTEQLSAYQMVLNFFQRFIRK
ncbi:MAG: cation:proton antiporter [Prevotellaceae bacterium]|nr:cation:proton antiporter [Prevotellaceae bacterium]